MASKKQKAAAKRNIKKARAALTKSPKSHMRKHGLTKGKEISTAERKKTATITEHTKGPRGGQTRGRFPIPDAAHARNAMARLNQAKGLTPEDKKAIARKAQRFIGTTPAIAKVLGKSSSSEKDSHGKAIRPNVKKMLSSYHHRS